MSALISEENSSYSKKKKKKRNKKKNYRFLVCYINMDKSAPPNLYLIRKKK